MKKIASIASLVLTSMLACTAAAAAGTTTSFVGHTHSAVTPIAAVDVVAAKSHAQPGKSSKAKPALDPKKFRYLDMVERKHPSSIRNAVIVYDHGLMKKKACNAKDPASVSECLGSPSV